MKQNQRTGGAFMRPKEVAKYLGVSKWAVTQLIKTGQLHGITCTNNASRTRFITRESVEAIARGV